MVTLNKPLAGDTNWTTPVNDNWTTIENSLDQAICEGRLSLSNTEAVPTTDPTTGTSIYFIPFKGDRISVYTGSTWKIYTLPGTGGSALALSLSGLVANVSYDVFVFDNVGTLTLEVLAWKKVTSTSTVTAGADKVLNVPDTAGLSVGDRVTVTGGLNNETAVVKTIVANTSITVDNLANGYTNPDVYYPETRATALTTQNGILVKSGVATRRFLGTIRTNDTAGTCEDSSAKRFVCNYYNRVPRGLKRVDTTDSWSDGGGGAWAPWNFSTANRVDFVSTGEDVVFLAFSGSAQRPSSNNSLASIGIGLDSITAPAAVSTYPAMNLHSGAWTGYSTAVFAQTPAPGYHYLQLLEACDTTTSFFGDLGLTYSSSGAIGWVMG